MYNDRKTAGPSKTTVINKSLSTKPHIKTNAPKITKPANTLLTQSTLRHSINVLSPNTPSSTPPRTPTPASPISPSLSIENTISNDINSTTAHAKNPVQNTSLNYASVTANENTPSREQALVFNSIDGIPQRDYVIAIGKLISPKNIVYASRISNNRFCIFLSSKQILDSLLASTQTITINEHTIEIRRLINPSKRIVISNVCPSIPNHVILDALMNINITPVSQIIHLKAGINIEGYDHISSFRRQLFIKHDDAPKLPGSLPLLHNHTEFRVFFTDGRITCFLCNSTGHTSNNCKKTDLNLQVITEPVQHNSLVEPTLTSAIPLDSPGNNISPLTTNSSNSSLVTPQVIVGTTEDYKTNESTHPTALSQNCTADDPHTPSETSKRPRSDTSSLATLSPLPPASALTNDANIDRSRNTSKKPKIHRSRSNSSSNIHDKITSGLKPAEDIFSDKQQISLTNFKYVLENYTNKNMNIYSICKDINSDITSLMNLIDLIRPKITDRNIKSLITRLANLLFQALPPSQDN